MSTPVQTPADTVTRFLGALADHDTDAAIALAAPDAAVDVYPLRVAGTGAALLEQVLKDLVRGFPDLLITVSRVIATGDVVTALFKAEGTQAADYAGAINQEKHLDIEQAWLFTTREGVITAITGYWDQNKLYRRLAVKRLDRIAIA
jgi:steroid delta-isomerase-like uncharacterized protein